MIKRRTMAVLGLATVMAGGAGTGMAYAAGSGSAPTLKAVPGVHPDLSTVKPGVAVPLGKVVSGIVSGGTTTAPAGDGSAPAPGTVSLQAVPGAKPDLSKVVLATPVPLGAVVHVEGSGTGTTTQAR